MRGRSAVVPRGLIRARAPQVRIVGSAGRESVAFRTVRGRRIVADMRPEGSPSHRPSAAGASTRWRSPWEVLTSPDARLMSAEAAIEAD